MKHSLGQDSSSVNACDRLHRQSGNEAGLETKVKRNWFDAIAEAWKWRRSSNHWRIRVEEILQAIVWDCGQAGAALATAGAMEVIGAQGQERKPVA